MNTMNFKLGWNFKSSHDEAEPDWNIGNTMFYIKAMSKILPSSLSKVTSFDISYSNIEKDQHMIIQFENNDQYLYTQNLPKWNK